MRLKYLFTMLCLLAISLALRAQVNAPVMATVQLNPPYSLYLSDYSAPDVQRMQVHLLLKDLTTTNYKCRLKITIEGFGITLQSKTEFYTAPILLNGGEMTTLSGADLAPYLNPQNLLIQGIDNNEFIRNGSKLPEGIYKFSVEVMDYSRKYVVSNTSFAVVSTFLSYPPIINLPMANTKVDAQNPQNMIFQWVPRHTASINSAFSVGYKFRLVELRPANRDPNDAMRTTRPIYETMTSQTMLVYGPAEPALTPGFNYAVQVQAIDAEGRDMFVNDGFSEVVPFTYGEKCGLPSEVLAAVSGTNSLKLTWTGQPTQQAFSVRYREAGNPPSQWYEEDTYVPQLNISGLKPGKQYEYQVKSQCIWGYGDYSETQSFTMPDEALKKGDFVCGRPYSDSGITNTTAIEKLMEGDTILAADFKVVISSVSGANGSFTGTGEVLIPFLEYLSVTVHYSNIRVNVKKQMYEGVMEIQQDDPGQVSAALQKTLTELLDNIDNALQTQDLASLQNLDAAGLLGQLDKMKDWDALSPTVKAELDELEGKLKEVQTLQQTNNLSPEEKATLAEKLATDIKNLTEKIKADLKEMAALLKEFLGLFRSAQAKVREENSLTKLSQLAAELKRAEEALDAYLKIKQTTTTTSFPAAALGQTTKPLDEEGTTLATKYKEAEKAYNKAQVLWMVTNGALTDEESTLVLQSLKIDNTNGAEYLKNAGKDSDKKDEVISKITAALLELGDRLMTEKIYK
jgi:hypothetical protein